MPRFQPTHVPIPTASESSTAQPQLSKVTAQTPFTPLNRHRSKGRPQGQEMEEETDTEDENPDDIIQVPRSLAQQKLAAFVDLNLRQNLDLVGGSEAQVRAMLPTVATTPMSLDHRWNLPAPAPPMTPCTTRRQMLSTELSESMCRNLLWERQVNKTNLPGNGAKRSRALGGVLHPLTMTKQADLPREGSSRTQSQWGENSRMGDDVDMAKAERRRQALAWNRSWADDYHYAGW